MKTFTCLSLTTGLFLATSFHSPAIVGLGIERQCTNIVISWPSQGYEYYLIQHRPTLDPSTPWENLTNNYPANSASRTTFTVYGVAAPCAGGGGMGSPATNPPLLPPLPLLMPADGSRVPVPLNLYPPGIDLTGQVVLWPNGSSENWTAELAENYQASKQAAKGNGPQPQDAGGGGVDSGFYRVFHIPDWAFNVTNYTYDGPVFFPVDFKDYRDLVVGVEVLVNGEIYPHVEFMTYDSPTNWGMGIYLDQLTNGNYQIQLVTTLQLNNEVGDNSVFLALTNLARPITVFNQVMFPDWNDFIQGDTYTFNAQLANPNTSWWIDIYDVWGNYVNTGSGHTTDGLVSWTWDLNDWQGNNRDDFDSDPYFYSEITFNSVNSSGGPVLQSLITRPTRPSLKGYPNRGEWLVAFQDRWYSDDPYYPPDVQEKFLEAMAAIRGGPILVGDTSYLYPLKFGTNVYTQTQREQTWTNLLNWIGDLYTRNFYYFGHGNGTSIGCDYHLPISTNAPSSGGLNSSPQSKSELFSWQIALKTKYNRYRFVFLDGCSTAAGDWPNAFNISKTNHTTVDFYENHPKHPRPSVFVGWNEAVGAGLNTYRALNFRKNWMGIWANSSPLPSIKESLEDANRIYDWMGINDFNSKIRFYGYQGMTIRDYNRKGDWRWE